MEKRLKLPLVAAAIFFLAISSWVHAKTATLSGTSASLILIESSTSMGGYPVTFLFTTYDGSRYQLPYYYDSANQTVSYNRELKKVGSQYKTDYFGISGAAIFDYGEISYNLPTTDQNGNDIDDICEKEKAVSTSISGNWYSADGTGGNVSGTLSRDAKAQQGTYNATIFNTTGGDIQISGSWYVLTMSGTIEYESSVGNFNASYTLTGAEQSSGNTFSSTYDIIDSDHIRVNSKDEFPTTVFSRSGNRYSAMVTLTDGATDTFWPDFQQWLYIIEDNNDADQDGIPDLSDTIDNTKFTITASAADANGTIVPEQAIVERGQSQLFTAYPKAGYQVEGWFLNGSLVQSGGNEYTLSNVQGNSQITVTFERIKAMPWLHLLMD